VAKPLLPSGEEIRADFEAILSNGILSKGYHCTALEDSVAYELDVKHAIAVSSCTTGLMLIYKALELTGDVIVPSFTFMATVGALRWAGLRPVFAEVDFATANVSPDAVRAALTPDTSAIVAVHNYGNPADIDGLIEIAEEYGLRLIFDAAHGFGARYKNRPVGNQGDAQAFSLSPTKLVVAGEGGIVTTNSDELAGRIRIGREFGNCGDYDSEIPGLNGRLPEVNALLGRYSLAKLEAAVECRHRTAELYRARLGQLAGLSFQEISSADRSSYKDFAIIVDEDAFGLTRDELALALKAENIDTRAYYDPPVHRQRAYRQFAPGAGLPKTETLAASILCLPIWSSMELPIVSRICDAIVNAHLSADSIRAALREPVLGHGSNASPITSGVDG
jgi:dTDP-4-amino-4,6-dideoxygalactose transaminase